MALQTDYFSEADLGTPPKSIWLTAEVFRNSADYLMDRLYRSDTDVVTRFRLMGVAYVNAAFAIEVYLKCLIEIDLVTLFDQLNAANRTRITEIFDETIVNNESVKNVPAGHVAPPTDLKSVLDILKNIFVEFRYVYSFGPNAVHGINEVMIAVRKRIIELHPNWESLEPAFPNVKHPPIMWSL